MGAELQIESEEVVRLAEELATLRKMSVPEAVAEALKAELRHEQESQRRFTRMEEIAADIRKHALYPEVTSDHSWLYDENGLPV